MRPLAALLGGLLLSVQWAVAFPLQDSAPQPSPVAAAQPAVAFTFDDLPAHGPLPPGMARPAVVASLLATLHRERMPPIYGFINGFRVQQYPYQVHILQAWVKAGNPLANHTWSHPELDKSTVHSYERDILRNEPLLRQVYGQGDWHWFRYPFLEEGDTLAKREAVRTFLRAHGYRIAQVSMDFQDYLWNEPYARCSARHDQTSIRALHDSYLATAGTFISVFRQLAHELYGRDAPYILLMHAGAFDARMLPELISLFREQGFRFVTLEEAMADPTYDLNPKLPNPGGSTFNEQVAELRKVAVPDGTEPDKMLDALCR